MDNNPFTIIDRTYLTGVVHYLWIHSLFLVGAIFFKTLAGPKTLIVISSIYGFCVGEWMYFAAKFGIADSPPGAFDMIKGIINWWIIAWIIAPVGWVVGYYLLKRKEA